MREAKRRNTRKKCPIVQRAQSLYQLKVSELKTVAQQSGLVVGGNKTELRQRIQHHYDEIIANATTADGVFVPERVIPATIVSFDLGYRNLAHVRLDSENNILQWVRVDLELTDFHPSVSAPAVRRYVKQYIEPLLVADDKPVGAIVVEQQRYRENGGFAVLEHTIRVNSIEAMLWYALHDVLERRGTKVANMDAIPRQGVDRVWRPAWEPLMPIPLKPSRFKKPSTYHHKKQACSRLVGQWLQNGQVVQCNSDDLKDMFLLERKKDDLSDCLLQGLTWYQWRKFTLKYIQSVLQ